MDGRWTDLPLLMDVGQVADVLSVSERTVWRLVSENKLETVDLGTRTKRFRREDVADLAGVDLDMNPCEEYREAIQQLLQAIDDLAGERGQHWSKSAHEAVENAGSLLE